MSISRRTFVSALFAAPVVAQAAVSNILTKPQSKVGRGMLTSVIVYDQSPWMLPEYEREYHNTWIAPGDPEDYIAVAGVSGIDTPTVQLYNRRAGRWTVVEDVPELWHGDKPMLSLHPESKEIVIHHIPQDLYTRSFCLSSGRLTPDSMLGKQLGS